AGGLALEPEPPPIRHPAHARRAAPPRDAGAGDPRLVALAVEARDRAGLGVEAGDPAVLVVVGSDVEDGVAAVGAPVGAESVELPRGVGRCAAFPEEVRRVEGAGQRGEVDGGGGVAVEVLDVERRGAGGAAHLRTGGDLLGVARARDVADEAGPGGAVVPGEGEGDETARGAEPELLDVLAAGVE